MLKDPRLPSKSQQRASLPVSSSFTILFPRVDYNSWLHKERCKKKSFRSQTKNLHVLHKQRLNSTLSPTVTWSRADCFCFLRPSSWVLRWCGREAGQDRSEVHQYKETQAHDPGFTRYDLKHTFTGVKNTHTSRTKNNKFTHTCWKQTISEARCLITRIEVSADVYLNASAHTDVLDQVHVWVFQRYFHL